ncbi:hypothetical protein DPMN_113071 [Dreissena polymorpha]|uniref:Reverse transcriptase RNase H-like domain-containing protein n=1 Tax=Dreissena polymorpha TaxID=45954 RepID=A0A9D4QQH2_DREPO|nr:hypothetical protein DPMN_113071 [Dreissena polymorpha]
MLARWLTVLDTYDFEVQYRKGSLHSNADAMSRIPSKCKRDTCPDCHATCDVDCDKGTTFTDTVSGQKMFVGQIGHVDNSDPEEQSQSNLLSI